MSGPNAWGGGGPLGGDFSGIGVYGGDPTHGGGRSTGIGTGTNVDWGGESVGPPAAGPMAGIQMGSGIGHDTMGNFSVSIPGEGYAPISGGSGYNANNMGTGTPTGVGNPMGYGMGYTTADMGPYGEFGPPQAGGYNMPGDVEGGGGEPLIRRLQGLTPEQQNFLLNNPQALRAFNQEYNRILQSGQGGQVGVGWSNDDTYTHGQYRVPPSGLISQGTPNRQWESDL